MARVMLVDDSDAIRMVLKDVIIIGQHELVADVSDSTIAVEEYTKAKPDVTLLDLAMPKKDGFTVLKEIIGINPNAKIIMLTASDNPNTQKECISNGASAYILKPFDFQEVLKTIANVSKS